MSCVWEAQLVQKGTAQRKSLGGDAPISIQKHRDGTPGTEHDERKKAEGEYRVEKSSASSFSSTAPLRSYNNYSHGAVGQVARSGVNPLPQPWGYGYNQLSASCFNAGTTNYSLLSPLPAALPAPNTPASSLSVGLCSTSSSFPTHYQPHLPIHHSLYNPYYSTQGIQRGGLWPNLGGGSYIASPASLDGNITYESTVGSSILPAYCSSEGESSNDSSLSLLSNSPTISNGKTGVLPHANPLKLQKPITTFPRLARANEADMTPLPHRPQNFHPYARIPCESRNGSRVQSRDGGEDARIAGATKKNKRALFGSATVENRVATLTDENPSFTSQTISGDRDNSPAVGRAVPTIKSFVLRLIKINTRQPSQTAINQAELTHAQSALDCEEMLSFVRAHVNSPSMQYLCELLASPNQYRHIVSWTVGGLRWEFKINNTKTFADILNLRTGKPKSYLQIARALKSFEQTEFGGFITLKKVKDKRNHFQFFPAPPSEGNPQLP